MQQASQNPVPNVAGSFAGMLATLTGPVQKSGSAWEDGELEDDVATLSYERALRTHARYRPAEGEDQGSDGPEGGTETATPATPPAPSPELERAARARNAMEQRLKRASVTVRLSQAESAQLRTRAGEAGLTVSAYLRSCTFEAETLRAQVKEALAELKAASVRPVEPAPVPARRSWLRRLCRPFMFWHKGRNPVAA